jgi:hypothetical protein
MVVAVVIKDIIWSEAIVWLAIHHAHPAQIMFVVVVQAITFKITDAFLVIFHVQLAPTV